MTDGTQPSALHAWIDVRDALPPPVQFGHPWCLVYRDGVHVAFYSYEFGTWSLEGNRPLYGVSHWQPLPPSPFEARK